MEIVAHPSPNFGERRGGVTPDLVVLHYTAMATPDTLARLCDPERAVSAHYLISQTGEAFQLVKEEKRAWHAGVGGWGACSDVNSASIGIELANDGVSPFSAVQIDQLEQLLGDVMGRWSIPAERVIGHSDMAYRRKSDPGRRFDWRRLALAGLSVWPQSDAAQGADMAAFSMAAQAFGYCRSDDDQALLDAVRLRFRPGAEGPLEATDVALISDLAARFPVDQTPRQA